MKYPDPNKHMMYSMIKSTVRIIGFGFMIQSLIVGVIMLIIAEGLGIIEELV